MLGEMGVLHVGVQGDRLLPGGLRPILVSSLLSPAATQRVTRSGSAVGYEVVSSGVSCYFIKSEM